MSEYINLAILIIARSDGSFEARASSPAGQGATRFEPPFKLADIGPGLLGPGTTRGRIVTTASDAPPPKSAEDIGRQLFNALFQGSVAEVLARTEGVALGQRDSGVRIRLSFDLTQAGIAEVSALPWELLRKPDETQPLLVSTQTVLVRGLEGPKPIMLRPLNPPLRVLLIQSNPEGTGALKLSAESLNISKSLARLPNVVVDEVEPVAETILDKLADEAYHVIHYMGHGDFEADRGGMLLLEKADGSPDLVSAAKFASWLSDEPLRLVFLNACETGTTPQFAGPHPFSGVAAALVANGVPAVVAMQFPITDTSALAFSRTFYERIAKGDPVDMAVAQGRKALFDDVDTEWATPVLYLRAENGNLFHAHAPEVGPTRQRAAAPEPSPPPPPAPPENWWKRQNVFVQIAIIIFGFLAFLSVADSLGWLGPDPVTEPATPDQAAPAPAKQVGKDLALVPPMDDAAIARAAIAKIDGSFWINDGSGDVSQTAEAFDTHAPALGNDRIRRAAALKQLADAGDPKAAYLYGLMIDTGYGEGASAVKPDPEVANNYYAKASDGNIASAAAMMAGVYTSGALGRKKNAQLAAEYAAKARRLCYSKGFSGFTDAQLAKMPMGENCQ
ncbi:MAG: CHAT domain-containing protein [Sphingomonadales bacterium]